jgi:hypothetical protein
MDLAPDRGNAVRPFSERPFRFARMVSATLRGGGVIPYRLAFFAHGVTGILGCRHIVEKSGQFW